MRIVLDLQGCQSVSRLRGIGRYSLALAKAIVRNAGDHEVWIVLNDLYPDTIDGIRASFDGLMPVERIAVFAVPRFSLYQGANDWRTRAALLVREYAIAELEPDVVHVSTLFEGYVDVSVSSVKELDTNAITAVTLYDLIPFLNPDKYLTDAGFKKHYYGKIEALKRADVLLAISEYCGEEAVRELDIPRERITNISSAVSESFVCTTLSDEAVRALRGRFGISRSFVMTTGIVEPRKNLEGLIVAYAKLPADLRKQFQLFMVCQATETNRIKLFDLAEAHGLARDELVLAGYVSDKDLIELYTACHLFVFPSLHEGFGLPALEAMACGSAVIASAATSIPEVIGRDDALFNPLDVQQMADMMERALSDGEYWQSLRDHAAVQVPKFSWDATGKRALEAFEAAYKTRMQEKAVVAETADERYRKLIDALNKLDLPATDADFVASADAIAANQRAGRTRQLFVDVSTVFVHDAKSGIQRVTRAIARQLLAAPPAGWQVRLVRLDRSVMIYRYANRFMHTLDVGTRGVDDEDDWVDSQQGDIFLGLDLVADCVPPAEGWFAAQRRRGVKIYFVVYDLLPVFRPEWFPEAIATVFPPWLKTIGTVADGLIGISRAVADDLKMWLDTSSVERARELKLGYFHLGADIENSQPSTGMPDGAASILTAMRERPTFLMVGTVEPRKGHVQAFAAFERLWAAHANVNLVVVGNAGWGVDGMPELLAQHPENGNHFFWLQEISDQFLEKIYESSTCLLAPSLGEGFGLPLIEAAQKGLPILARELPVFREIAGDHAFYFKGDNPEDLAAAVEAWILLQKEGKVPQPTGMEWLTWKQSAEEIGRVMLEDAWYQRWMSVRSSSAKARAGLETAMPKVLYWVGLTASQPFNTGVQRVTRCLGKGLQELDIELVPIKWNHQERRVTSLNALECEHLAKWGGPKCAPVEQLPESKWLILPEITYPLVPPGSNVAAWAKSRGIKTASVFYDMIPLKTKELYDAETLGGLSAYWRSFAETDLVLPISQTVAPDLADWLASQRLSVPSLVPCLLSGEVPGIARETKINMPSGQGLRLLAIGTWEPRKNYPRILRAIGKARQESGVDIQITIAGRHARKEFPELHDEIEKLARDLGQHVVSLRSQVSDSEMSELTRNSHATIFGSWLEGFGLPVLESLWQGKPCICHDGSALAEIAPGGGTLMVDMQSEDSIAGTIARVASDRAELQRLYQEANERPLRTWADYARDVYTAVRNHEPLPLFAPLDFLDHVD